MKRAALVAFIVAAGIAIGFLIYRARCEDGSEGLVEFPYEIEIAPQNVLFVDGYEFHGKVTCTWEPGDSLRIEGIPILPRRPLPFGPPAEEREAMVRALFGKVPFVQEQLDSGKSWSEAMDAYERHLRRYIYNAKAVYWRVLERTRSEDSAVEAVIDSLDRSYLDPSFEPRVFPGGMQVKFLGERRPVGIDFGEKPPWEMPSLEELQRVTHKKASDYVTTLEHRLGQRIPTLIVISDTASLTLMGRAQVQDVLDQIEEGRKGRLVEGPLDEEQLKLILLRKGVKIDELQ